MNITTKSQALKFWRETARQMIVTHVQRGTIFHGIMVEDEFLILSPTGASQLIRDDYPISEAKDCVKKLADAYLKDLGVRFGANLDWYPKRGVALEHIPDTRHHLVLLDWE